MEHLCIRFRAVVAVAAGLLLNFWSQAAYSATDQLYRIGAGSTVVRVDAGTGSSVTIATISSAVFLTGNISVDKDGNLFVVDRGTQSIPAAVDGRIWKVTPAGVVSSFVFGGLLYDPIDVAIEANGNFVVLDSSSGPGPGSGERVIRVNATTTVQTLLAQDQLWVTTPGQPRNDFVDDIEVAANGDIFVAALSRLVQPAVELDPRMIRVNPATGVIARVTPDATSIDGLGLEISLLNVPGGDIVLSVTSIGFGALGLTQRFNPSTGVLATVAIDDSVYMSPMIVASDGFYFVERISDGALFRLDPTTLAAFPLAANSFGTAIQLAACTDRFDNDGDGIADLADSDCRGRLDNSESAPFAAAGWRVANLPVPWGTAALGGVHSSGGQVFAAVRPPSGGAGQVVRMSSDGSVVTVLATLASDQYIGSMDYDPVTNRLLMADNGVPSTVLAISNPFGSFPSPLNGATLGILPNGSLPGLHDIAVSLADPSGNTLLVSRIATGQANPLRVSSVNLTTGAEQVLQALSVFPAGIDTAAGGNPLYFGSLNTSISNGGSVSSVALPPGTGTPVSVISARPGQFDLKLDSDGQLALSEFKSGVLASTFVRANVSTGGVIGQAVSGLSQPTQVAHDNGVFYLVDVGKIPDSIVVLSPITECNDGIDNDGDGNVDALDGGCPNPLDPLEYEGGGGC